MRLLPAPKASVTGPRQTCSTPRRPLRCQAPPGPKSRSPSYESHHSSKSVGIWTPQINQRAQDAHQHRNPSEHQQPPRRLAAVMKPSGAIGPRGRGSRHNDPDQADAEPEPDKRDRQQHSEHQWSQERQSRDRYDDFSIAPSVRPALKRKLRNNSVHAIPLSFNLRSNDLLLFSSSGVPSAPLPGRRALL